MIKTNADLVDLRRSITVEIRRMLEGFESALVLAVCRKQLAESAMSGGILRVRLHRAPIHSSTAVCPAREWQWDESG